MNELYKVASKKRGEMVGDKPSLIPAALLGSAPLVYHAPKNILGYHKVFHGTPIGHDSIKAKGLRKGLAGTGSGGVDIKAGSTDAANIRGKVFTTTDPKYALGYTNKYASMKTMDDVIKMRVPYRHKGRMARDVVVDKIINREIGPVDEYNIERFIKHRKNTHVYKHSIPARFIEGSSTYKGISQFANKGHIRRYLAQPGGKARMALGIGQLLGAGGLVYGAHKLGTHHK